MPFFQFSYLLFIKTFRLFENKIIPGYRTKNTERYVCAYVTRPVTLMAQCANYNICLCLKGCSSLFDIKQLLYGTFP